MKYCFIVGVIVGPRIDSFLRLKSQLEKVIQNTEIKFIICRFGYSQKDFSRAPKNINIEEHLIASGPLSICEMRNQVQFYVALKMKEIKDSIGLILDEDLECKELFVNENNEFSYKAEFFENKVLQNMFTNVDASVIKITGDPPIPKTYCQTTQLRDVLSILEFISHLDPKEKYQFPFNKLLKESDLFPELYHDILCLEQKYEKIIDITNNSNITNLDVFKIILEKGVPYIEQGKSFTRVLIRNSNNNKTRGGAFIVYNPEILLRVKNESIFYKNGFSRRSDMVMVINAMRMGFSINTIALPLHHSREGFQYEDETTKVLHDCIGHSLVRFLDGDNFRQSLITRIELTKENIAIKKKLINKIINQIDKIKNSKYYEIYSKLKSNHFILFDRINKVASDVEQQLQLENIQDIERAFHKWWTKRKQSRNFSLTY